MTPAEFEATPFGSLLRLEDSERAPFIEAYLQAPLNVRRLIVSPKTGAYLRGLMKTHDLPLTEAPRLAFSVFLVAIGEQPLSQLQSNIATQFSSPEAPTDTLAREIERDLFAPVALELNQYLKGRQETVKYSQQKTAQQDARNVIDLTEQRNTPPPPPPLPR